MEDKRENIDNSQLISRYLAGEADGAEVQRLEKWVLSAAKNKAQFTQYKKAWILSNINDNPLGVDINEEWERTAKHLFNKEETPVIAINNRTKRSGVWRVAAAIAVLVVAAIYVYFPIELSDYQVVESKDVFIDNQLPDGSMVALNQYSTIQYSKDFEETRREVTLKGDAFFDIKRDTSRPFIITTDDVQIEVLGTSFYVDSRTAEPQVEVIVKTGVVAVTAAGQKITLGKGETGIYEKASQQLFKKENEDVNYLAWTSDTLVFDSVSLETVVHTLNRQFHVDISLANPKLKKCYFTTTFIDKSLDLIIEILEATFNITTEKKGERIILKGEGCD